MFVILLTLILQTFYDIAFLLYKKKKKNSIVGKKLKNNELEQFLCAPFHFEKNIPNKASSTTIVKIVDNEKTEKLLILAKISELENKLSIVCVRHCQKKLLPNLNFSMK